MRVLIDTTYAQRAPLSGTGIYIDRLCRELEQREDVEMIRVANAARRAPAGGGIGSVRNLLADGWWTNVELPRMARRVRAEIIHHSLPAFSVAASCPQVVTVVDLAFERLPECFDRGYRTYAHLVHRAAARRAAAVIAISETTASDARHCWGVDSVVAHLGPGQELEPLPRVEPPKHFLYVGDQEPRKNLATLLGAYARYRSGEADPLELVLAGSAGVSAVSAPGVRAEVRPSGERVSELLAATAALVHPSLYEGFGLTPLEAMRAGAPVLAARSPGTVETCADAPAYFEQFDVGELAALMSRAAADPAFRATLIERGARRVVDFSWAACARAHVEAYSLALGG